MVCYITYVMLCYKHVLCYVHMLYDICYVMLYNLCYTTYVKCYVI